MSLRGNKRQPPERSGRVVALVATLAAPVLLYLIVRTALVSLSPVSAMQLPPVDATGQLRGLALMALHPERRVTPAVIEQARQGAIAAPLAFEPYVILAKAAEQRGDLREATRLMEEVRRRRANFVPGRLQLIVYYADTRRFDELFPEIETALRLEGEVRRLLLPEMARLISDPQGRRALARALVRQPEWRNDFFAAARSQRTSPEHALALLNDVRREQPRANLTLERQLYVDSLVDAGRIAEARAIWLERLPADQRTRHANIFNGAFQPIASEPPFGWELHELDVGRAGIVSEQGQPYLDVNYFGGRPATLAGQLLALRPGSYRLRYNARSGSGVSSAQLAWSVTCLPDREILRAPVERLSQTFEPREARFTVPASCSGQRLELQAQPGEISTPVDLQIGRLELAQ